MFISYEDFFILLFLILNESESQLLMSTVAYWLNARV